MTEAKGDLACAVLASLREESACHDHNSQTIFITSDLPDKRTTASFYTRYQLFDQFLPPGRVNYQYMFP
ncbi:hypothetical protein KCP71_02815 [Salmonella enterica subsp. enterica]|nr:hypothetical protein KCP71_02815 [Salmonella enterica subsp. enterica]